MSDTIFVTSQLKPTTSGVILVTHLLLFVMTVLYVLPSGVAKVSSHRVLTAKSCKDVLRSYTSSTSPVADNRIAVCISGAARTLPQNLSFMTLASAFSQHDDIKVDFFSWLSNDPDKGDVNSKGHSFAAVSNGLVRARAAYFARLTPLGTYVLNEVNFQVNTKCDFGRYSSERFDQSDEDIITRMTQPLFKREKYFELVRAAEEEMSISAGKP
jgi:hypothetical protein